MLKEKIKQFVDKKAKGDNKKNIENLVVFLILLIVTVIAINTIWSKDNGKEKEEKADYKVLADINTDSSNNLENSEYDLQNDLEDILSKMYGVGKVKVLVTYSQKSKIVPMYSESESKSITEENDSNGGSRKQEAIDTSKEVVMNGDNQAITQTILLPQVEGTIVIAEGGGNATTKSNIIQAVAAVTGLATYKVQVFEMSK